MRNARDQLLGAKSSSSITVDVSKMAVLDRIKSTDPDHLAITTVKSPYPELRKFPNWDLGPRPSPATPMERHA